jgi:aspartyl-tRNA(Asn)/glutamyl-tRNA(Gln) amidotransferase subunit A
VRYGIRAEETEDVIDMFMKTRSKGFGNEVKRRIMLGTYALQRDNYDAYYLKALKVRTQIKEDFDRAFEKYDLLLSPVSPTTAFRIGEKTDDLSKCTSLISATISVNLAGNTGDINTLRFCRGDAGRPAADGQTFRRGNTAPGGVRLLSKYRLS